METKNRGHAYIVSGPSGVGKSTVLQKVFKCRNLYFSVSATTRAPRPDERDGVEYLFVSREWFEDLLSHGGFLEHAEYTGNLYGTPAKPVLDRLEQGQDVVMDIEVQGARQVKEKLPEAVSVFIVPPSIDELERRLRLRSTESEDMIARRLETASRELRCSDEYDFVVVNDSASRAAKEILEIMDR